MSRHDHEVIIVGAGAAGLMCAATVARSGKSVLVLDHAEKAGKKILISGGGRCNFTNRYVTAENYLSANPHFCKSALARFTQYDFIEMVEANNISYHERDHGQLFCDNSAKEILEMLMQPCREFGVGFRFNTTINDISKLEGDGFRLQSSSDSYDCGSLVIATGGLSIPKMGATSFGYKIAAEFGLKVVTTAPALVPFTFTGQEKEAFKSLAGISLEVTVACRGKTFREAMLFTHRGISGPAMLQISSYWQPGDSLSINLLPDLDTQAWLEQKRHQRPKAQLATILAEVLPKRLVQMLMPQFSANLPLQQLSERQLQDISSQLQSWEVKPNGTEGYRTAEATVGGIDTDKLSSTTMESKKAKGLYFIGEVVDVTGQLGGYNFQWAWSSGYAAGMALSNS